MSDLPTSVPEPRLGEDADWQAVLSLADPQRRSIYELLRSAHRPMRRDEVSQALGIPRSRAVFHLERLAEDELLTVTFARPEGRGGPGAGRPAKFYAATDVDLSVQLPVRRYALLGRILAAAVADAGPSTGDAMERATTIAFDEGRRAGSAGRPAGRIGLRRGMQSTQDVLAEIGYEPTAEAGNRLRLRNCPFHHVVKGHADVVCQLNQCFVSGILDGIGAPSSCTAVGDSVGGGPEGCCVTVRTDAMARTTLAAIPS